MQYVIGTHASFINWCKEQDINPRSRSLCSLMATHSAMRKILGRRWQDGDKVITLHDFASIRNVSEIFDQLKMMGCPEL